MTFPLSIGFEDKNKRAELHRELVLKMMKFKSVIDGFLPVA